MRAQCLLAFALVSVAAMLPGRVLAQADAAPAAAEQPEEVTVRGRKTMTQYRLELERAREDMFKIFNEANKGDDTDITCRQEQPTGTRMRHTVCRSEAEQRAQADAGRKFLNSLTLSAKAQFARLGFGGETTMPQSDLSTFNSQESDRSGVADSIAKFEDEWMRIISDNRDLYRAVTTYMEIENEYARARGDTPQPTAGDVAVVLEEAPAQPNGPQCEASTLTEFQQRNNLARVSGTVSLSMCPAGTTGSFTLVARIRDDTGEIRPIEFNETWQRADDADHIFNSDYPIGDNVELLSVRVRGLSCTCATPVQ